MWVKEVTGARLNLDLASSLSPRFSSGSGWYIDVRGGPDLVGVLVGIHATKADADAEILRLIAGGA